MAGSVIYEDRYGEVIDRPESDIIEIRWFDGSADFGRDSFNEWLGGFAGAVEGTGRSRILVDATSFHMDMEHMDAEWRDANVIPRYMGAGVSKFAFLMPRGMPAVGTPPTHEGPADFPTAYFDARESAVDWLTR